MGQQPTLAGGEGMKLTLRMCEIKTRFIDICQSATMQMLIYVTT